MVKEYLKKAGVFVDKNAPTILVGFAVGGVVVTAYSAFKAGPKVNRIVKAHKEEMNKVERILDEEEYKKEKRGVILETAKELAPVIIPPIIFGGLTITSIIVSHKLVTGRAAKSIAALSAAYEASRLSLRDLERSIEDVVPKKAEEIKEKAITNRIKDKVLTEEDKMMYSERGKNPCRDTYINLSFYSTKPEIELAAKEIAIEVRNSMDDEGKSVSDLYAKLGVPYNYIPDIAEDNVWQQADLWGDYDNPTLPIKIATCWDSSGTIPVIGVDTRSAHPFVDGYAEKGDGSFR